MKETIKECLSQVVMSVDSIKDNVKDKPKKKKKKRVAKSEKKKFMQYTKIYVTAISICACIWVTWSYFLATYALKYYGSLEPLKELSQQVITSIICVCLGYFTKSFVETYCEKKMEQDVSKDIQEENEEIKKLNEEMEI